MESMPTRNAYGEALVEAGEKNDNFVVVDADISKSTRSYHFHNKFPNRSFNVGVAEQNMVLVAAGLATTGFNVFANTYAVFASMRAIEQVRTFVCYPNLSVKIVGSHGGLQVSYDGVTHQGTEDIAMMRVIPNMTVLQPSDPITAKKTTHALSEFSGPAYLRLTRNSVPVIYEENIKFEIGKGIIAKDAKNPQCTIFATGIMVSKALEVAKKFDKKEGMEIKVIDIHTIKPLDTNLIIETAKDSGCAVVAEDHNILGGLGGAISEIISSNYPVPIERIGVKDVFGESGDPELLFKNYEMSTEHIRNKVEKAISRK